MAASALPAAQPPNSAGPGVLAWRAPGGGLLVVDAYATGTCRLILPAGAAPAPLSAPEGVRVSVEQVEGRAALRADAGG